MPSWQARCLNASVRAFVRRPNARDERALTHRARFVFGTPAPWQWLRTRGLQLQQVRVGDVRGEWLTPAQTEPGTIFYIHGGGYIACSAATHRPITAALARLSQRRVFSINYRLAPEHRFPAALDDAFAAYEWLLAQGHDASTIAFAGDSAGGGLVLATLLRARAASRPLPACAVCFSPWTDLAGTGASVQFNDGRCAMFHPENIHEFAAAYLGDASARDPYASPVFADLTGLPPLLLQVGSTELILDDARRIHEQMLATGGVSRLEIFDDVAHCWQMLDGLVPEARAALQQAAGFISDHLNRVRLTAETRGAEL